MAQVMQATHEAKVKIAPARSSVPALILALWWVGAGWAVPAVFGAETASDRQVIDNDTCFACHGDSSVEPFVDLEALQASTHGTLTCTGCHTGITTVPHDLPLKPVNCATCHEGATTSYLGSAHGLARSQGVAAAASCLDCHGNPHELRKATDLASTLYWRTIPETCGQCHTAIHQTFLRSVHGRAITAGKREAPVCTDCHGEHTITAINNANSTVFPSHIPDTCGQCHAAARITTKYRLPEHVVDTYMDSFHGLSAQLGSIKAANCASCHGVHDILPSKDPQSSIHPTNLAKTCGACHAGVTAQVAKGKIHSGTRPELEHQVVSVVRHVYLALICLVIGGMLVHNMLDFLKKTRAHYRRMAAVGVRIRMSLSERIQHGLLGTSFIALAYTGFALKFPQAWWASPFVGRVDWRSVGHRTFAVLFCILALYHLWYVLCTARGRRHVRALSPRRIDFVQPFQMLAYYLGARRERPVFAQYSYVEKAEYWALVWGSVIMTLTGALMTWEGWTLRIFPKWFFDAVAAVHYYEAILACLAILVWHFYFVIFDPDEYPMKWTWVTGQSSEADRLHRAPDDEPPERPTSETQP